MQLEPSVLVVAGSDSGAGAGLQADLKACSAFGVYTATAVSAVTVQNTFGVRRVEVLSAELVAAQMRAVLEDFAVAVIKIGMLGSAAVVQAVAEVLDDYPAIPVVLDPVLLSTSGAELLEARGVVLLRQRLLSRVLLVTPNLAEAALLAELSEEEVACHPAQAAERIVALGAGAVLVKGGHRAGEQMRDLLLYQDEQFEYSACRVVTPNLHGTGCTLASAIAANLVLGEALPQAVAQAKRYLTRALQAGAGRRLGRGCGPMEHRVSVD